MNTESSMPRGLTHQQAMQQLKQNGYNELPSQQRRTILHIIVDVLLEPMFLLLLIAGTAYFALGELSDALMLLGFVCIIMAITILQERKTERALETLRDLASPRALVIRSGEHIRIAGRDVVTNDLMVLEEGDRIAADGLLLECHDLLIDESLVTGESVAVTKEAFTKTSHPQENLPDNMHVYAGSLVARGGGLVQVTATGAHSTLGKIGTSLQTLLPEKSPLQHEINRLVYRFAWLGAAISFLVFALYTWKRHDWLHGLLSGITLAMSILPEEFTVILTVFMALGAWRIAKDHVLTRHTPVIEALGSATVLCVDKTGTLTQNQMSVQTFVVDHHIIDLNALQDQTPSKPIGQLLEYAVLASEITPFDPMEKALHYCQTQLFPENHAIHKNWTLTHEYPLTREITAMTHVWHIPSTLQYKVATKGAPETVTRLCKLEPSTTQDILQKVQLLAQQGKRVLAVALANHTEATYPATPEGFNFTWLGLIGLADPLRPEVPMAIKECHTAGINVTMITGDYPTTAQTIAKEAGIPCDHVITGTQMNALNDIQLQAVVRDVHIFARIHPEQKLRLVSALKTNREIVAMTGDGVNDAPALKAAHIGISMGKRGTDVAREASSLVLLDDDFISIVRTIRLGRRIYDNLRKAMIYSVAIHLPIAGIALLPLLFGTPIAFSPIHIIFLEMIINPTCAIVFEAEEAEHDIMKRPPRGMGENLFGLRHLSVAILQGIGLLIAVSIVFFLALQKGWGEGQARAMTFTCFVIGNLGLIIANRSIQHSTWISFLHVPNRAQWWVISGAGITLTATLNTPWLQKAFHFSPLNTKFVMLSLLFSLGAILWFETIKHLFLLKHIFKPKNHS